MNIEEFKTYINNWYCEILDENFDEYGDFLNEDDYSVRDRILAEVGMLESIILKLRELK